MADVLEECETYLKTISDVTDLVGTGDAARIYYDVPKQAAALPFVVLVQSGGEVVETVTNTAAWAESAIQIFAFAATRLAANNLDEQIRLNLQRYVGDWGTIRISEISRSGFRDAGIDQQLDRSGGPRYWTRGTYFIQHSLAQVVI